MKKIALATVAAAALLFGAPAFTAPALAQADVKVKVKSGDHGMTKKKVVIRHGDRGYDRKKVVIKHGDRGRHHGWDRGRHRGWAHSNHRAGTKIVIKRGGGHHANRTVIKKKTVVQ
jgi:hypothetical protein